jgi:hypothetical protein
MGTMLIDDLSSDVLNQQMERANLRLAWRMRFSDFHHAQLTLAQRCQLQAKCLRVFGPRWRQEIEEDDCAWEAITLTAQTGR